MQHVVSALNPNASLSSRASLRLVSRDEPVQPRAPIPPAADDVPGREREKRLVDQSRDAHFAVRRRFRELAAEVAGSGLEFLYDQARRIDTELAGLYQARAAVLAHRLQRATAAPAIAPTPLPAGSPDDVASAQASTEPRTTTELSIEERALVMRLRGASERDRRTLLHLAVRFSDAHRVGR